MSSRVSRGSTTTPRSPSSTGTRSPSRPSSPTPPVRRGRSAPGWSTSTTTPSSPRRRPSSRSPRADSESRVSLGRVDADRQKHLVLILAREFASNLSTPTLIADARGYLVYYNEAAELVVGRRFSEAGEAPL